MNQADFEFSDEVNDLHKDVVFTPQWLAQAMVDYFKPTGRILDPCRGQGQFSDLMPGCDWCELQEGRDFFEQIGNFDWVLGNPPYSIYSKWLRHSMDIADNIVYLIPINKFCNSSTMLRDIYTWGGVAEIIHIGEGSVINFPICFACGAIHYKRDYEGPIHYREGFEL